jgi:hypothetical protein
VAHNKLFSKTSEVLDHLTLALFMGAGFLLVKFQPLEMELLRTTL